MCTDLGLSKSILTDLKMGRKHDISATNAQKIASYLGVTVGYLLGEDDPIYEVSYLQAANKLAELVQDQDFIELYELYCKLNKKNKQVVKGLIESLI
jgi:transcriptional regulator with XRE-family HTH domain